MSWRGEPTTAESPADRHGHHDLRRDVGAGRRRPARSTSARASRTPTGRPRSPPRPRRAILEGRGNQYPPGPGIPELRHAVAAHQKRFYGLDFDPDTEVLVTAGATEAIAAALHRAAGAGRRGHRVRAVLRLLRRLRRHGRRRPGCRSRCGRRVSGPTWTRCARPSPRRTRLILLNTPHNPTGAVFTRAELAAIAELACEHDLLVVTDEVYEHMVFDG